MEDFRYSIKTENDDSINKKQLFYEFFLRKYNINSYDVITEENLFFLKGLPADSLLYETYRKSLNSVEGVLTLDVFIDDILHLIKVLHSQIVFENANIKKMKENLRITDIILKKMDVENSDLNNNVSQINLNISYVKDKKYESQIFKYCRLKYKVSSKAEYDSNNLSSIYSEKKRKVCNFKISKEFESIFIHVLGKKIDIFNQDEEFKTIATAEVPLILLFSSIKPIYFEFEEIPPVYQIINYQYDLDEDESETEKNELNCCFELKILLTATKNEKMNIMKNLLTYYPEVISENEIEKNKRVGLINELLLPFDGQIVYDQNQTLFLKKNLERSCSIDFCLLI